MAIGKRNIMNKITRFEGEQLLYGDAVNPGECICIVRSRHVETVIQMQRCGLRAKKEF